MPQVSTVVVLAAGEGTRMKSARPKVLHPLCGRPMIAWVLDQALALAPRRVLVVVGSGATEVERVVKAHPTPEGCELACVVQEPRLGTGHALMICQPLLEGERGQVVVLYGDMPALRPESLRELCALRESAGSDVLAITTTFPDEIKGYGRVLRGEDLEVRGIVEERDASPAERGIPEGNVGVYACPAPLLLELLPRLGKANAQGEYYLTDLVGLAVASGRRVVAFELQDPEEALGVNTLAQLAMARDAIQERILEEHLARGVLIEDPASTWIDHGVEIGAGTHVLPACVIRSGVRIGAGCEVGPFAHLRAGTVLEDGAEVGNFTECKNSTLGRRSKAKHLSYLGDAEIGAGVNVGAGTIFANYDGKAKHRTEVGDGAFLGSGTIVVAPNHIGAGATIGAGAVVTRGAAVGPGELWLGIPARRREDSGTSEESAT
jgi:bifunctional UDP-N-acetylglucosamine pyrophosphorylase/glucosamine-1-phosphate N-acetyltransferase